LKSKDEEKEKREFEHFSIKFETRERGVSRRSNVPLLLDSPSMAPLVPRRCDTDSTNPWSLASCALSFLMSSFFSEMIGSINFHSSVLGW